MSEFATPSASAVILAAGKGTRVSGGEPKQFLNLCGKPVLARSLQTFASCESISEIIIVAPADKMEEARKISQKWTDGKAAVITGGKNRFESARLGFYAASEEGEAVVLHDAARPFVEKELIERCVRAAIEFGAATAAIPLDDSIKLTGNDRQNPDILRVVGNPGRKDVWRVQTPQAFRRDLLAEAYENFSPALEEITDETALFTSTGGGAVLIPASKRNMKITTRDDFAIAELIAENMAETEK
ncbi:2-C-methyl-D-erythritol 4-phosphate cytidylyltransferase [Candidatus Mycalebacterium sp.]